MEAKFLIADLIVVLHQLDDDPYVVRVVFDGDNPHNVGCVLRVRILTILVGQYQASIRLMDLQGETEIDLSGMYIWLVFFGQV